MRRKVGSSYEYSASALRLTPIPVDPNLPEDYEPFPGIQITDFSSWSEVRRWAEKLFQLERGQTRSAEALADDIRFREKANPLRVLAALRAVQDKIRYVSVSFAENTHRPAQPGIVLSRGYGDCKDKSLLLVAILRALGFEANVALVSSRSGRALLSTLPTLVAFDHAIVAVQLDGYRYWLDPTRLYQRGSLAEVAPRGFHYALLLDGNATELTLTIPHISRPIRHVAALARVTCPT
jgi:transglutaminase-like putative cysteine protease